MSHREKSGKHEQRVARRLVKLTPNSGAGSIKGDVHEIGYLVEHKYTDASQYILKRSTLDKTEAQAWNAGKKPKWIFTILGKDYTLFKGIL